MPIQTIPSADYYLNESLHGNYQYVTLEDIINNFIMSGQDDDYTANVDRYKILFQARRAFRELYFDAMQEIRAIALDLSPQLNVVLPPDFINYVRISWVDGEGKLHPMAVDDKISLAVDYLQADDYELLFDSNGCVLQDSGGGVDPNAVANGGSYHFCQSSFQPNKNMSNSFSSGSVKIDKNNGFIKFGSEVFGKTIVLEYISDGLFTGCEGREEAQLRIHKFAETAVYDWMYWKLIERRRNVPANEKMRARKEWFNSRRLTKRRINTIRADELRQVFKGSGKWIKGI